MRAIPRGSPAQYFSEASSVLHAGRAKGEERAASTDPAGAGGRGWRGCLGSRDDPAGGGTRLQEAR
ncbi:MAG: hypothetical protein QHH75_05945 [Bacillota bacterium]|nr:hypothetical protein [Bacillota bacterium]